jgi:redox-sensitive bicupin YhaK (pirin superfamily)
MAATAHDLTRTVQRDVAALVRGRETSDGAGVRLRRLIGGPELEMFDPFLMLDAFRSDDPDDYIAGFPPHPHRGFETVTYLLAGRMRHRDSAGHQGVLRSGGVQWMTAGCGIEHSEMPEQENGLMSGFQLWVNLPAEQKMSPPRYQEFDPEQIPLEGHHDGGVIAVIAGTTDLGTEGPVRQIAARPIYLDVTLPVGAKLRQAIPRGHSAFIYMIEGVLTVEGESGERIVPAETLAVLGDGDGVHTRAGEGRCRFLLVAGKPFGEPVARSGPFVMNSEAEIRQAYADYRDGLFGRVEE